MVGLFEGRVVGDLCWREEGKDKEGLGDSWPLSFRSAEIGLWLFWARWGWNAGPGLRAEGMNS